MDKTTVGQLMANRDTRPACNGWAHGFYIHVCSTCKEHFVGDKRAVSCAKCAYKKCGAMHYIKRWFREMRTPRLKCERSGCEFKRQQHNIRKISDKFGCLVDDFRADFEICNRCGKLKGPLSLNPLKSWSKIDLPDEAWKAMRKKGYIIIE